MGWNCALMKPSRSENFKFVFGFLDHWLKSSGDVWNHVVLGSYHVLALREKRRHIAYRIPFVFFFLKISALHTQKGPLYEYYHVLGISITK